MKVNIGDKVAVSKYCVIGDEFYEYLWFKAEVVRTTPRRYYIKMESDIPGAPQNRILKCDSKTDRILYPVREVLWYNRNDSVLPYNKKHAQYIEKSKVIIENCFMIAGIKESLNYTDVGEFSVDIKTQYEISVCLSQLKIQVDKLIQLC